MLRVSATLSVFTALIWGLGLHWYVAYRTSHVMVTVGAGGISYLHTTFDLATAYLSPGFDGGTVALRDSEWGPIAKKLGDGTIKVFVPGWLVVLPCLTSVILLSRRKPGDDSSCSNCGYSQEGLVLGKPCPECGQVSK